MRDTYRFELHFDGDEYMAESDDDDAATEDTPPDNSVRTSKDGQDDKSKGRSTTKSTTRSRKRKPTATGFVFLPVVWASTKKRFHLLLLQR